MSLRAPVRLALGRAADDGAHARVLRVGQASRSGLGKVNEDACGVADPDESGRALRGYALAIADGVGTDGGGRIASQAAVHAVLHDLYATPAQWTLPQALDRVLVSINDWLHARNARQPEDDGAVTTLTLMLISADRWRLAHVGDTRAYRWRDPQWRQLTADHTWPRRDMRHVLKRALGLDTHVVIDQDGGPLEAGDRFLLASDGVWEVLGERALRDLVGRASDPQVAADALVSQALEKQGLYMGRNDASAVVAMVD
jgi:protein phosphatase